MMFFLKIFFSALLLILVGGFVYLALTDVPVQQTPMTITLSAEEFKN